MRKLFEMEFVQKEDILLKGTSKGDLLISETGKGTFKGETMSGRVKPVGMCRTYTLVSGVNLIDAPMLLETNDGVKILMEMNACLQLPHELEEKFIEGVSVNPDQYYYKGSVRFVAEKSKYSRLENRIFLCEGIIDNWSSLRFQIFEV